MHDYANGIDNSPVNNKEEKPKSIGNSVTLPKDIYGEEEIYKVVLALTEQVAYRLRLHDLVASTVNIQLRNKDFKDISHQKPLKFTTSSTREIASTAKELLHEMYNPKEGIRLVGVRVDNLEDKDEIQLSIFSDNSKQDKIDNVLDDLKKKYGYTSVTRAGEMEVKNIVKGKEKKIKAPN